MGGHTRVDPPAHPHKDAFAVSVHPGSIPRRKGASNVAGGGGLMARKGPLLSLGVVITLVAQVCKLRSHCGVSSGQPLDGHVLGFVVCETKVSISA